MGGKSSKSKDSSGKKKQQPTISEDDIKLLIENTTFKRDEIIALHRDFFRDCPSGKINSKEFAKKFKSEHLLDKLKKSKPDKYCEFAFNAFDKNHFVSYKCI